MNPSENEDVGTPNNPTLASTQLLYPRSDAIEDLQNAPSYSYTITVFLRSRQGATFEDVAYTEQVKHFMGICLAGDSHFMILKSRKEARINAITRQAEVPENTFEFEEDFARDIQLDGQYKWVRMRISVASSKSFDEMFRNDNNHTSKLIRRYNWFVEYTQLEHHCHMVHIGWFKYLHPAFVNRDDLRKDFTEHFGDDIADFDFTSKVERRTYVTTGDDGVEKKESCNIRVLSIFVPVDIASRASELIMEYWGNELATLKETVTPLGVMPNRLIQSEFIPNSAKFLPLEDQIQHLLAQGLFLTQHRDPIIIHNCTTIDDQFECSEEMAKLATSPSLKGTSISLKKILATWVNVEANSRVVLAIEQMSRNRFAVLVHEDNIGYVRNTLNEIIEILRRDLGDKFDTFGGVRGGIKVDDNLGLRQSIRARSYLQSLQHKRHYVKPQQMKYSNNRQLACVSTDTSNSRVQRLYSDVIQQNNPPTTIATSSAHTSTTSLTLSQQQGPQMQVATLDDFNRLVQKKVESMLAPTLQQLNQTIETVQQASSRVDSIEQQTQIVQKQQEDITKDLDTLKNESAQWNQNIDSLREENKSQFDTLLSVLSNHLNPKSSPQPNPNSTSNTASNEPSTNTSNDPRTKPSPNVPNTHAPTPLPTPAPTNKSSTQHSTPSHPYSDHTQTTNPVAEDPLEDSPTSRSRTPTSSTTLESHTPPDDEADVGQVR